MGVVGRIAGVVALGGGAAVAASIALPDGVADAIVRVVGRVTFATLRPITTDAAAANAKSSGMTRLRFRFFPANAGAVGSSRTANAGSDIGGGPVNTGGGAADIITAGGGPVNTGETGGTDGKDSGLGCAAGGGVGGRNEPVSVIGGIASVRGAPVKMSCGGSSVR